MLLLLFVKHKSCKSDANSMKCAPARLPTLFGISKASKQKLAGLQLVNAVGTIQGFLKLV